MSGRHRIIAGELAESGVRGKELADKLAKEMLQDEKNSSYEKEDVAKHDKSKK